jgi:hypothetical protein
MSRARRTISSSILVFAVGLVHCTPPSVVAPLDDPRDLPHGSPGARAASNEASPTPDSSARAAVTPDAAPVPEDPDVRYLPGEGFAAVDGGRRGAVLGNTRVLLDARGAHAVDPAPIDDLGRAVALPSTLGGGTVFVGSHKVRFAATFDGELATVADLPEVEVGFGYHRILVSKRRREPMKAEAGARLFELPSGREAPNPNGFVQMFGTPRGMVAAVDGKGALFVSSAGSPWKKLPSRPVALLRYDGRGVVVDTDREPSRLGFDQVLAPMPRGETGMTVSENAMAFMDPYPMGDTPPPARPDVAELVGPFARRLDRATAFSVESDQLTFRDAGTGKPLKTAKNPFGGRKNCFPIRGGTPSFVGCNGDGSSAEGMALFRIESVEATPVLERAFPGIYTQDFGEPSEDAPLAFAGACSGKPEPGTLCVRRDGQFTERRLAPSEAAKLARVDRLVHVATSREGAMLGFGWEGGDGDLVMVDFAHGKVRRLRKGDFPAAARDGIRWSELTLDGGELRFVLASGGILKVGSDDRMTLEPLAGTLYAHGARGLLFANDGRLRETQDAGKTFRDVTSPPGGSSARSGKNRAICWETGCVVGPWYRTGWTRRP